MVENYKLPNPKRKKLKAPLMNSPRLPLQLATIREANSTFPIIGMIWGGNVWITDTRSIQCLTQNGCYGNSVTNRHVSVGGAVLQQGEQAVAANEPSSGCGSGCGKGGEETADGSCSPPRKKSKLLAKDGLSISDGESLLPLDNLLLNIASHHALLLEESFYLVQRSCMGVKEVTKGGAVLSVEDTRTKMTEYDERFNIKYCAYEYFRNRGWVPKCGVKFGVDYLLYEPGGPMLYHSSLGVMIVLTDDLPQQATTATTNVTATSITPTSICLQQEKIMTVSKDLQAEAIARSTDSPVPKESDCKISLPKGEGTLPLLCDESKPPLTWQDVLSTGRVNEGAKKDVIICYVIRSSPQPSSLQSSRQQQYKVLHCVVTKRWLIEKDRVSLIL